VAGNPESESAGSYVRVLIGLMEHFGWTIEYVLNLKLRQVRVLVEEINAMQEEAEEGAKHEARASQIPRGG